MLKHSFTDYLSYVSATKVEIHTEILKCMRVSLNIMLSDISQSQKANTV